MKDGFEISLVTLTCVVLHISFVVIEFIPYFTNLFISFFISFEIIIFRTHPLHVTSLSVLIKDKDSFDPVSKHQNMKTYTRHGW